MPRLKGFRYERGVFALRHKPTGKLYIAGSEKLHKAWDSWIASMISEPHLIPANFPTKEPADWEMQILKKLPPETTAKQLRQEVNNVVTTLYQRAPDRMLNPQPRVPKTVSYDGKKVTLGQLSKITGIGYMTLYMRQQKGLKGPALWKRTPRSPLISS